MTDRCGCASCAKGESFHDRRFPLRPPGFVKHVRWVLHRFASFGIGKRGAAAMLTIWGRKTSSNVQALMWCVGELELPFQRHDVGHRYGGNGTPEFLAMNPNGT